MPVIPADPERKRRIDRVLDYIFSHLDGQISLQTLAGIAHYSPFHLQRIFKQMVGDSPKQYIIKLRLETAFHLLVIHPQKSIQEIAVDSGFSHPTVFSRATKSYFGYSPEQIRMLPHREQMRLLHTVAPQSTPPAALAPTTGRASTAETQSIAPSIAPPSIDNPTRRKPTIHTLKKAAITGIYLLVPFDNPIEIQRAFATLSRLANIHAWPTPEPGMYGILGPHQRNTYKAFLPIDPAAFAADKFPLTRIKGGTFATFNVRGHLRQTNKAAHHFYRQWLPDSGYKIAGVTGFETFSGNPAFTPYHQLEREIHIPIEPAL